MIEVKVDLYKPTGKWYTTFYIKVAKVEDIDNDIQTIGYKGMIATTSYCLDDYFQPYRLFNL